MRTAMIVAALMLGTSLSPPVASPYSGLFPGGTPGVDYAVGRTSIKTLAKAVYEKNYYRSASKTQIVVNSALKGTDVSFTIDSSVYPFDLRPRAMITMVATATIGGSLGYLNGQVKSFDPVSRQLVMTVAAGSLGHGGAAGGLNSGTGGLSGFGSGLSGVGTAGTYSDWSLTLHLPSNWGAYGDRRQVFVNPGLTADAADTIHSDWDFKDLCCYFAGGTSSVTNPIKVTQSLFDEQTPLNPIGSFFSAHASIPTTLTFCDVKFNFRRFGVTAVVTADAAAGVNVLYIDALPNKSSAVPGGVVNTPVDANNFMVINLTNPSSMGGCLFNKFDSSTNALTLKPQTEFVSTTKATLSTVKAGDVLMFVPACSTSGTFSGAFAAIEYCNIDGLADVFSGLKIAPGLFPRVRFNKINIVPVSGSHVDLYQRYDLAGDGLNITFNWINFGFWDEEPLYSAPLNFGGMNYSMIGDCSNPWVGSFTYAYNVVAAAPGQSVLFPIRAGDYIGGTILSVRSRTDGKLRVALAPYGNGFTSLANAVYRVQGTGTSMDGLAKVTADYGSLTAYSGKLVSTFATTAQSDTGSSTIAVTAAVGATLSQGMGLALSSSVSTLLGCVSSVSVDKTTVTLDAPLAAAIASGTSLGILPYIDLNAALAAGTSFGGKYTGTVANNSATLVLDRTTDIQPGMAVQGQSVDNVYVKSVDSSTQITLSKAVTPGYTSKVWSIFPVVKAVKTGFSSIHDLYFRNPLLNTQGVYNQLVYIRTYAAASIYNLFELEKRTALPFNTTRQDGTVMSAVLGDYAPLMSPTNFVATPLGNGKVRLDFDAVSGAAGYAYSLDGGVSFAFDQTAFDPSASGQIAPGSIVTLATGPASIVVAAFNCPNELGIPVGPGAVSSAKAVTVT